MPDLSGYVTEGDPIGIAELIALKAASITVGRDGSTVGPQTVRIETLANPRQMMGEGNVLHTVDSMALGYHNHPTIADTDLRPGDTFVADGRKFLVIMPMPGHIDCLQVYLRTIG